MPAPPCSTQYFRNSSLLKGDSRKTLSQQEFALISELVLLTVLFVTIHWYLLRSFHFSDIQQLTFYQSPLVLLAISKHNPLNREKQDEGQ